MMMMTDDDVNTDKYISFAWASLFGSWPGTVPIELAQIKFSVNDIDGTEDTTTKIAFSSASTAAGYGFVPIPYDMPLYSVWDFDKNGNVDALTDGLLLLRYTFGFTGDSLTDGVVATTSTLTTAGVQSNVEAAVNLVADIDGESFLVTADIDGDGSVDALTDGLLFLQYAFNLRGDALIQGAVADGATRTTAENIEQYISTGFIVGDVDSYSDDGSLGNVFVRVDGTPYGVKGQDVTISVMYEATDENADKNADLTGLGLNIHYDSDVLTFVDISYELQIDLIGSDDSDLGKGFIRMGVT